MVLKRIAQPSLRERAVQELRDSIANGRLRPGARLLEVAVSEQLGVSRGTVREAFRQLEEEGLLTSVSRGPVRVRVLDRKEVGDIYAVRAALEGLAARAVAIRVDREEALAVLEGALRSFTSVVGGLYSEQIERDLAFHEALCALSGNEALRAAWGRLSGPIRAALISVGPSAATSLQTTRHHQQIVDAIARGDADAACLLIERHLQDSANILIDAMSVPAAHEQGAG